MDLVVDKSGAADAISERIEHKDGVKSGKANRMFQLLLIGWVGIERADCKPINSAIANSWA